jgi:hypothetical protein
MKIVGVSNSIVRFLAVALGAASAIFACTSSGDGPAIGDGGPDGSTTDLTADADPANGDAGAVAACVSFPMSIATVDAGPLFECYQTACASEFSACAADCVCNGAIMTGLQCLLADAGSAQSCFYPPILRSATDLPVRSAGTCLNIILSDGGCERSFGAPAESGGDAAPQIATDAAGAAGNDGGSDTPASD